MDNFNFSTMEENLYINFKLGKKHEGSEHIYFKNSKLDEERIINNIRTDRYKIKLKNKKFVIQDDYNEKNSTNRIGTTITNLINKSQNINIILNKGLEELKEIKEIQVCTLCLRLEEIIKKFGLKKCNEDENEIIVDKLFKLIDFVETVKLTKNDDSLPYNLECFSEIENDKTFELLYNFYKEAYLLKNEFWLDDTELKIILEKLLKCRQDDIEEFYYFDVALKIVKTTVKRMKKYKIEKNNTHRLNKPLKCLVNQAFLKFNNDYQMIKDKQKMQEFLKVSREHYNDNPYNTYYKNISEYMDSLSKQYYDEMKDYKKNHDEDKILPKKFQNFSYIEMAIIFIQSFIDDLKFIKQNYNNTNLEISYIYKNSISSESEFKITSFKEIFYISVYYVKQNGDVLKECNRCKRIFIAQKPERDKACQRPYHVKKTNKFVTCREYNDRYLKSARKEIDPIQKQISNIETKLEELYDKEIITDEEISKKRKEIESIQYDTKISIDEKKAKLSRLYSRLKNKLDKQNHF